MGGQPTPSPRVGDSLHSNTYVHQEYHPAYSLSLDGTRLPCSVLHKHPPPSPIFWLRSHASPCGGCQVKATQARTDGRMPQAPRFGGALLGAILCEGGLGTAVAFVGTSILRRKPFSDPGLRDVDGRVVGTRPVHPPNAVSTPIGAFQSTSAKGSPYPMRCDICRASFQIHHSHPQGQVVAGLHMTGNGENRNGGCSRGGRGGCDRCPFDSTAALPQWEMGVTITMHKREAARRCRGHSTRHPLHLFTGARLLRIPPAVWGPQDTGRSPSLSPSVMGWGTRAACPQREGVVRHRGTVWGSNQGFGDLCPWDPPGAGVAVILIPLFWQGGGGALVGLR